MLFHSYPRLELRSDRSGQSSTVQLPEHASIENISFDDIAYHSGEPYSAQPWTAAVTSTSVSWYTDSFDVDPNANALRFDTICTFSFDANIEPGESKVILGLFKPGLPDEIAMNTLGRHFHLALV